MNTEDGLDPALADTAAELSGVLAARRLSPVRRRELYARAVAMAEGRSGLPRWRGLSAERWLPAAVGGAILATDAGAAIGVAVTRGPRQQHALAA